MTRLRIASIVGLTAAAFTVVPLVYSAPAPKPKEEARTDDRIEAEPIEGDRVQLAAARMKSSNNLKQLGLAFHNYADDRGTVPADITDKDGKPLLSWRVRLLPYIEQEALYKQFKLDEPWDSPTNKALLEKMPKTLESPRVKVKKAGYTVYQGFAGPGTPFEAGKALRFPADITDGTSNTIFTAEASTAVPWTKPADLPFDPKADLPDLGKAYDGMPLFGLLDGSVRVIKTSTIDPAVLKALITRSGGEVIGN
jgi:hypothetical protein